MKLGTCLDSKENLIGIDFPRSFLKSMYVKSEREIYIEKKS
jgi:hypothetical protein